MSTVGEDHLKKVDRTGGAIVKVLREGRSLEKIQKASDLKRRSQEKIQDTGVLQQGADPVLQKVAAFDSNKYKKDHDLFVNDLLEKSVKKDREQRDQNRLLIAAAKEGNLQNFIKALADGAELNSIDFNREFNAKLFCPEYVPSIDGVVLGVKSRDIPYTAKSKWLGTALMTAAACGQLKIVRYLLDEKRIDINTINFKSAKYFSALSYAARHGHENIVFELLSHKAAINGILCLLNPVTKQFYYPNILSFVCFEYPHIGIIKKLLAHNNSTFLKSEERFDINRHDGENTALGHILFNTSKDKDIKLEIRQKIVDELIRNGANTFSMPLTLKMEDCVKTLKELQNTFPSLGKMTEKSTSSKQSTLPALSKPVPVAPVNLGVRPLARKLSDEIPHLPPITRKDFDADTIHHSELTSRRAHTKEIEESHTLSDTLSHSEARSEISSDDVRFSASDAEVAEIMTAYSASAVKTRLVEGATSEAASPDDADLESDSCKKTPIKKPFV